ncbi:MAG: site-specific tyrosine recombinase XerC [Deltaproteobacteria bacterium]|nr:site-specific tyrosine recombinase XerC [Deltaproteobacteria bacterium]
MTPRTKSPTDTLDPDGLVVWARRFAEHLRVRNYAERTIVITNVALSGFIEWAADRSLTRPGEITKPILESYQRWLFYRRTSKGRPLTFSSQRISLTKVKGFFRFLAHQNVLLANPAADLELPRVERRLPRAILNERETEHVLAQADVADPLGLRDRTMMEVLYSTGIRRFELAGLQVYDLDTDRGTLTIRQGKGRKDRIVPIGERALHWIARYLDEVRRTLVVPPDGGVLFLNEQGRALALDYLTNLMKGYIDAAKLGKTGAVHIFRHTMATLMLEGGADVRLVQEMLGHANMSTTAIYTHVSIRHLKAVHDATHPAAKLAPKKVVESAAEAVAEKTDVLAALDAEADEEGSE